MKNNIILGSHVGFKSPNYLLGSVEETLSYDGNCFMVFTGPPQNFIRKAIDADNVKAAHKLMSENALEKRFIIVHAPYLINLSSVNESSREYAIKMLTNEIIRTDEIGSNIIVLHPGNFLANPLEEAIKYIAFGINKAIENTKNLNVVVSIETMAGKGTEVGRKFEELKQIIDLIDNKNRIGVCLDTCHIHEAGYDVSNPKIILKEFDKIFGLNYLNVIHLNDSKNERGAKKDRHENIGRGKIGFEILCNWVHEPLIKHVPKILETPYYNNKPIYKKEINILINKKWEE